MYEYIEDRVLVQMVIGILEPITPLPKPKKRDSK